MPKDTSSQQKQLVLEWIKNGLENLQTGEELYLPCHSKDHQKRFFKAFKFELWNLEKVDPISATSLHLYQIFKDKRFWVVLRKTTPEVTTGFKKDLDGNVSKISLTSHQEQRRRISFMLEDGLTWEEIEEMEGEIPEELRKELTT